MNTSRLALTIFIIALTFSAKALPDSDGASNPCQGSSLYVHIARYDLDGDTPRQTVPPTAREAYDRGHPRSTSSPALQIARLEPFSSSLAAYKSRLKALNAIVQSLFFAGADKNRVIDDTFAPIEDAVQSALFSATDAVRFRVSRSLPADLTAVSAAYRDLRPRLQSKQIELDTTTLEKVLGQLREYNIRPLDQRIRTAKTALEELKASAPETETQALDSLAASLMEDKDDPAPVLINAAERVSDAASAVDTGFRNLSAGFGDLVPRLHQVYQDMADPFWTYIATHPEHWQELDNSARVCGDGDTEYILVFEQSLDARWKSVTVDPSKVIRARLQIARKAAQTVIGLLGVSMTPFDVSIPKSNASGGTDSATIDYSTMTAASADLRIKNDDLRARLKDIKTLAAQELTRLVSGNAAAAANSRGTILRSVQTITAE